MATNRYFNTTPTNITSEMNLVESLVIEALQIHGMDVFYLPRTSRDTVDYLYGEDQFRQYLSAFDIEMYLENVSGMEGEGDFISKFGLEIRDEVRLLVSRKRFRESVYDGRPKEGDLVYIPMVANFFEITFVEHENDQAMFYTLGKGRSGNVYVYALKLKQLVFSNEIIHTGVEEIDMQINESYPRLRINVSSVDGVFLKDEIVYQGVDANTKTAEALVSSYVANTYIDVYRTNGVFVEGLIKGITSNASANVVVTSDTVVMDDIFEDLVDNNRIETESDVIVDWSEKNPFGEI